MVNTVEIPDQFKNQEFLKGLSGSDKEKILQILQNDKKEKEAEDKITNATYDLIENFETGSIGEEAPIGNLLDEGISDYYSGPGRSYGNHQHHCYIHKNMPVRIGKIRLAPIDSIIDKISVHEALALPGVIIDKDIDETAKGVSPEDKKKLFELATRPYKWTFSGRKIINPEIEFEYNGYHVKANLNDYDQKHLVLKCGKVYPQKLIVHNKEKTLQELRSYLEAKYSHINGLVNKKFPNIMKENGSMKKLNFGPSNTTKQQWIATMNLQPYDTHKNKYGISQELRLLFYRCHCDEYRTVDGVVGSNLYGVINILIGVVSYDILLPNGSLYNKEALEHHTQLKIQRTEEENRKKILDILNNSKNQSRHEK